MKAENVKTPETARELSSHGLKKAFRKAQIAAKISFCRRKPGSDWKKIEKTTCNPVEQEENPKRGPRQSWAGNHMRNPD
jgi:hypothetical protein